MAQIKTWFIKYYPSHGREEVKVIANYIIRTDGKVVQYQDVSG